jgi:DNA-binding response OmpR family regulator
MTIQRPDAVLMDAGITPAASADVWRALDQSNRAARVVMIGKFRHDAVRAQAREHGAVCLAPQSEEDLVSSVQELIRRYQMGRLETERLHSELESNIRRFQLNAKRAQLLDQHRSHPEGIVILVAEDEECVRRFLAVTLERRGYLVLEAADGKEAVMALWNYAGVVRLVVLDWAMPGLSGVDVVRMLRRVSPETRLLICTGSPEEVVRSSLRSETVEGVLEKPFLAVDFLETVERQMREAQPAASPFGVAGPSPR